MEIKNWVAILADCLEFMRTIPDGSIDAIITDPPFWTTACKWDSVIPFEPMWKELKRIIKPNGAIVLFGSEPFSSALRMSNIKQYKYDWKWIKNTWSNFLHCSDSPIKNYEDILVFIQDNDNSNIIHELHKTVEIYWDKKIEDLFYKEWRYWSIESAKTHFRFKFWLHKTRFDIMDQKLFDFLSQYISFPFEYNSYIQKNITYNPQGIIESNLQKIVWKKPQHIWERKNQEWKVYIQKFTNFPKSILDFKTEKWLHPTQKPVALLEYLIKTYTNEWETVLDFTAWSWTLWCAAQNTKRKFVCIEKDEWFFNIMCDRLKENRCKNDMTQ